LPFAVPDNTLCSSKASLALPSAETSPFPCFEFLTEDLPFSLRARTMKQEEKADCIVIHWLADKKLGFRAE